MAKKEQDALDAMSSEFIAEIKDDLASLETDLLVMEEKGAGVDDDLINHAFRSIHSIKGGAGFLNFQTLSSLSHVMESVFMRVREKTLVINSEIVDALLSGFDKMKSMVDTIGSDKEDCDFSAEQDVLKKILESGQPPVQTQPASPKKTEVQEPEPAIDPVSQAVDTKAPEFCEPVLETLHPLGDTPCFADKDFKVDAGRLESALKSQKYIYAVYLDNEQDLKEKKKNIAAMIEEIESIGDILYSDADTTKDTGGVFFVVATILDFPLLTQVLEIENQKLALLDQQFTDINVILKGISRESQSLPQKKTAPKGKEANQIISEKDFPEPQMLGMSSQTIRINVDLISRLMNRAGELVLSRNQLRPILERYSKKDKSASHMMQNLDVVTTDIQEAIMQMRMQPIIDLLGKYKRVVRDIARRISKKVELVIEGADVEVDRTVLEKLANPVTHLIRNCIDHGIELPEDRIKASKPETGTIHIKAFHQGGHVHLIFSDDGAGIDPQLVLSKAYEKGLVKEDQLDKMTDKQKVNLVFLPGFSTSEQITDISGRGVGMDVVKTNIERLRGQIEIDSEKGKGTKVHLIIPLTLAIVPSLIVSTGEEKFAIPQVNIKEIIYLDPGRIHHRVESIGGSEVLRLRDELLPVLRLRNTLGMQIFVDDPKTGRKIKEKRKAIADRRQKKIKPGVEDHRTIKKDRRNEDWDATYIIILKIGRDRFGLCVDELFDIEEVVVEPLSEYIKNIKCFSGATILGDGNVIMILDVSGIAATASLKFETIKSEEMKRNQLKEDNQLSSKHRRNLIVFCNDDNEYFALELQTISRLEPIIPEKIHYTGRQRYIEHNGEPVLLISMDDLFPAGPCALEQDEIFAIFPKKTSSPVGILASKIIDTYEINEKIKKDHSSSDAVMGKVFLDENMIQILDPGHLVNLIEKQIALAKEKA